MRISRFLFCIHICLILYGCNNNNSTTGIDNEVGIKNVQTVNSVAFCEVDQDKTKWFVKHEKTADGDYYYYGMHSDNYYLINGRKIALEYTFQYWPQSQYSMFIYSFGFSFIDVTNKSGEGSITPTLSVEQNANSRLNILWADGSASTLTIEKPEPRFLIIYNPWAEMFQQMLNERKKFSTYVITSTGQSLKFSFDISQRGGLSV